MIMITVSSFEASPESFAPYSYACKYSSNLHKRYAEIAETLGLHNNLETPCFGRLNIHICQQSHCKKSLTVTEVISTKGCKTLLEKGHFECKSLRSFLERSATSKSAYMNLVVINEGPENLEEVTALNDRHCNMLLIVIADENSEGLAESKYQAERSVNGNIIITSRAKLNEAIGDELERIVLKTIKTKCENVDKWLNEKKCLVVNKGATCGNRKRKSFFDACCKIKDIYRPGLHINDKENDQHFCDSFASRGINGHVSTNIKDATFQMNNNRKVCSTTGVQDYANRKYPVNTSLSSPISDRLQGVDRDTLESLLAEMIALYNNSKVPDYERPQVSQYEEKEISEELRKELQAISSVIGVGYRFTCFVVYVERGEKTEYQQQKIRSILEGNEILDYEIQYVSKCKIFSRVGSKIRATRKCQVRGKPVEGTLGCFAKNKDAKDRDTYALISKHVASFCDSFYISGSSASEILGKVIQSSVSETGLDIAALRLRNVPNENISICAKFKSETTDGEFASYGAVGDDVCDLLKGKLHTYSDYLEHGQRDLVCEGLNVYIWGAVSKPGKGVITMRAFKKGDMKALILVEDRKPSKKGDAPERFCSFGDSGAIVCAEDSRGEFVHILAMLIGIINEEDIQKDQTTRGKYLSVPLSSGLQELDERTGYSFKIFECID
ncbi:uncharacterized protein LOC128551461 [Mercenaria mercenaria]|uniref:uncharacterized protein LOC128551461 n=1 Tax=Mercenaria mercenaria TaxID=6596 RepID=UPI00234F03B5|nr:uncharacterized protein LOC128551461 [Mercenaria mercenaria]